MISPFWLFVGIGPVLSWPISYHRILASTRIITSRQLKIKRLFQPKTDNFLEVKIEEGVCVCVCDK